MSNPHTDEIVVLKCREPNKKATKVFTKALDGKIEKVSFSSGTFFTHETRAISCLDDIQIMLKELASDHERFVIRGKVKAGAGETVRRKKHPPEAAFDDCAHRWVILDIDKLVCPDHIDPVTGPEEAARWCQAVLPEHFQEIDCIYKFSSSQSVPQSVDAEPVKTVSAHLVFWCDRPVSDAEWKRYFVQNPAPVDTALFSCVQIHYTASPIFVGLDDPLPVRIGFLKGKNPTMRFPDLVQEQPRSKAPQPERIHAMSDSERDRALELLSPYYEDGKRDRLSGALAGALYRGGYAAEEAAEFVHALAEMNDDNETDSRYDSAIRICEAIDNDRPATGIPVLRDEFSIKNIDEILQLLGIGKPDPAKLIAGLSNQSPPHEIDAAINALIPLHIADQSRFLEQIVKATGLQKSVCNKLLKQAIEMTMVGYSQDRAMAMVEAMLRDQFNGGKHLARADDGKFRAFTRTHWVEITEDFLRKQLLPYASGGADDKNRHVSALLSEALNILKGRVYVAGDPFRFYAPPPNVFNCLNGEVWIDDDCNVDFRPHRAESYLRTVLQVNYQPGATAPAFCEASLEIFSCSEDPEDLFRNYMELTGYICQPWRKIPVIVLMHGGGSNGKTSLVGIIERLLGSAAIMSDRIADIEKNPFKIGALSGKYMLLDDDVEVGTVLPDGFLKKSSEEKTITGQHKFGPLFEFKCRAVAVMLSNHFPMTRDLSNGLRRRMMVIPFARRFSQEEIIPDLFDKIWEAEAPGILNLLIEGFIRVRKRGRFQEPAACVMAREEWLNRSNALSVFLNEYCVKDNKSRQTISEFYSIFVEYCRETGVSNVLSQSGVKSRLESLGYTFTSLHGCKVLHGVRAPRWGEIRPETEAASNVLLPELLLKKE